MHRKPGTVLFADIELAARIERAECKMLSDAVAAIARRRPSEATLAHAIAGGIATYGGEGSPLNKVAGLGFAGPLEEGELTKVERELARRGAAVQIELPSLADPSIGDLLTGRGYRLKGFENISGRRLPVEETPVIPGVEVSISGSEDLAAWLEVVVTGFSHPDEQGVPSHEDFPRDTVEQVIADMSASDGFRRYLARVDGVPAGGGSMKLSEGVALLAGAATLPAYRRRGAQTALLARRLADAAAEGCDIAVVTTLPGSKSQQNVRRRGFELLYTRAVLVREDSAT